MKKNTFIALAIIILVVMTIGGKWYMDREKDKQELLDIQTDLANYIYNNYKLYIVDEKKDEQLNKEYNKGNGTLTLDEFLNKSDELKEYSEVKKIEFTGFSVSPMNTVKVSYIINNVIKNETSLDTISAETNKLRYRIGEHFGEGPYYLEKKETATNLSIPKDLIIYYHGGVN